MEQALSFLTFDEWVRFFFDHEVRSPEWYWDIDSPYWDGPADLTVRYITTLFEDPCEPLGTYTDEQLNQGFWYLVSSGGSDHMRVLSDLSVAEDERTRCLRAFVSLFGNLFASRCSPYLSHLNEFGVAPLNLACYMWWDLIPLHGTPEDDQHQPLDRAALDVMAEILTIDSIACQESALHGLGHWHFEYPTEARDIIDRFLRMKLMLRPQLVEYAKIARIGHVL